MDTKTVDRILAFVGIILVIGLIFTIIKQLNKSTETKIISDKALEALGNEEKKLEIKEAIKKSIEEQKKTGVWHDPVVDLK